MATTTEPGTFSRRLDELEERLATIPAAVLRFERAAVARATDISRNAAQAGKEAFDSVLSQASRSVKVVGGTVRHEVEKTASSARTGARRTKGQTSAQARETTDAARSEVESIEDSITHAIDDAAETLDVDDHNSRGYERWTRDQLYQKAVDLDIDGRSSMTKDELVKAIRQK